MNKHHVIKKIPHDNIHYNKYLIKYKKNKLTNENINRVGLFRSQFMLIIKQIN